MMSNDAGKTWKIMRTPHGDNHDIWINPNNTNIWISLMMEVLISLLMVVKVGPLNLTTNSRNLSS